MECVQYHCHWSEIVTLYHTWKDSLHIELIRCVQWFSCSETVQSKAPVTLSRLDRRPFPTWMVGRGLVKSCGSRERTGMGLGRSWEVGELGRGVPDYSRLFWTVQNDREWSGIKSSRGYSVRKSCQVVGRSLGERGHSRQRTCMVRKEPGRPSQPTTHDWITSV